MTKVRPDGVELSDGSSIPADAVLWIGGVDVTPLAGDAGITTDEHGRVITDASLRSVSHPEVFAVGDAAAVRQPWSAIHGTCQSGIPAGAFVAEETTRPLAGCAPPDGSGSGTSTNRSASAGVTRSSSSRLPTTHRAARTWPAGDPLQTVAFTVARAADLSCPAGG